MLDKLNKIKELTNISESNYLLEAQCSKNNIKLVLSKLKENNSFLFDQLLDITAVDHPSREFRFDVIYILQTLKNNKKLILKISLKENETIDSITSIHKSADWYERECYDLFGIEFKYHPDLRRIMTDYNFEGHPLRKDFPLTGHSEVRYSEDEKKVISEPVKLEQNFRNFDYQSPWEGTKYIKNEIESNDKKN